MDFITRGRIHVKLRKEQVILSDMEMKDKR
jgi:hypothetical protein